MLNFALDTEKSKKKKYSKFDFYFLHVWTE